MARTSKEVFENHKDSLLNGDMPRFFADYDDESVFITLDGTYVGIKAIKSWYLGILDSQPNLQLHFENVVIEEDTVLLQWSAESDAARFPNGVATFFIRDGIIKRQTEWFIGIPK